MCLRARVRSLVGAAAQSSSHRTATYCRTGELAPKSHALDLSLAITGILLCSAYFVAISVRVKFPFREQLFFGGRPRRCDLFVLPVRHQVHSEDFCIVCASFHVCNFSMLVLAVLEYRNPEVMRKI